MHAPAADETRLRLRLATQEPIAQKRLICDVDSCSLFESRLQVRQGIIQTPIRNTWPQHGSTNQLCTRRFKDSLLPFERVRQQKKTEKIMTHVNSKKRITCRSSPHDSGLPPPNRSRVEQSARGTTDHLQGVPESASQSSSRSRSKPSSASTESCSRLRSRTRAGSIRDAKQLNLDVPDQLERRQVHATVNDGSKPSDGLRCEGECSRVRWRTWW